MYQREHWRNTTTGEIRMAIIELQQFMFCSPSFRHKLYICEAQTKGIPCKYTFAPDLHDHQIIQELSSLHFENVPPVHSILSQIIYSNYLSFIYVLLVGWLIISIEQVEQIIILISLVLSVLRVSPCLIQKESFYFHWISTITTIKQFIHIFSSSSLL